MSSQYMKRSVMVACVFILILISLSLIQASEQEQVEKAYTCLENNINKTGCSALSFEQKVFSLLAVGKCKNETMLENLSNQCWPKSGCRIKPTAQAILALSENGVNTTKAESWLLTQTAIPSEMDWFLETESLSATTCTISYSASSYTASIAENKKISSLNLGNCLTLARDGYWLKISPSCYNADIDISCDKSFITTLLFKKKDSLTVHVSETVHSASTGGKTTERVDSFCFAQNGVCNYEGSLWAAFVLYARNQDVSKFMPYLITMMDNESNKAYIPESFLYFLTGEFRTELLLKQTAGSYWELSGDRYYDTALALWPLYYESSFEKQNSKSWLLSSNIQQNTGCWDNGNIRNTAFILYSIWPRNPLNPSGICYYDNDCSQISCQDSSCNSNVCVYDPVSCMDNDGCCSPGCSSVTDNDCSVGPACVSDYDCMVYVSATDNYCSLNKTQAWKNVSNYSCENSFCVKHEQQKFVESCSVGEECRAGSCLSIIDIPDDCETIYDCVGENCVNGECVPYEPCTTSYDCTTFGETCIGGACVPESLDCIDSGYDCMSPANCEGEILSDYGCTGVFQCCDTPISSQTCSIEGGEICADDESCVDGTTPAVSDTAYGESCCVGGTCEKESIGTSNCAQNNGICKSLCGSTEEENSGYSCGYGDVCCMSKTTTKSSYVWVWVLLGLILLSAVGIVFRDKLTLLWLKLKGSKGDNKKRFEMPHSTSPGGSLPRRVFSPQSRVPIHRPIPSHPANKKPEPKPKSELDDVLKKLKEIGK